MSAERKRCSANPEINGCPRFHRLWSNSNESFVPAEELPISIYVRLDAFLHLRTGLGVGFANTKVSNPVSRSALMPAAFSNSGFVI
jgi:hypothetical protein